MKNERSYQPIIANYGKQVAETRALNHDITPVEAKDPNPKRPGTAGKFLGAAGLAAAVTVGSLIPGATNTVDKSLGKVGTEVSQLWNSGEQGIPKSAPLVQRKVTQGEGAEQVFLSVNPRANDEQIYEGENLVLSQGQGSGGQLKPDQPVEVPLIASDQTPPANH